MRREKWIYLVCVAVLLSIGTTAYAAPDEELYMLTLNYAATDRVLVKVDIGTSALTFTDIVSLDDTTYYEPGGILGLVHDNGTFYFLSAAGGETKLYSINTVNGDATLKGTLNVDSAYQLTKNPADNSVWVSVETNDGGYPDSVAPIDLSNGEVDLDNAVALPSPRFSTGSFFDGFGRLYGTELSANTSWSQWWFRIDLDTGALSPDCQPGGGFAPCWTKGSIGWLVTNPDTYEIIGVSSEEEGGSIVKVEFLESYVAVKKLGGPIVPPYFETGPLTFAPNVQSEDPKIPPDEILFGGICG